MTILKFERRHSPAPDEIYAVDDLYGSIASNEENKSVDLYVRYEESGAVSFLLMQDQGEGSIYALFAMDQNQARELAMALMKG